MALIGELDLDFPLWMLPGILITWSPLVKLMAHSDSGSRVEREATLGLREGTSALSAYWGGTEIGSCGDRSGTTLSHQTQLSQQCHTF